MLGMLVVVMLMVEYVGYVGGCYVGYVGYVSGCYVGYVGYVGYVSG